MRTSRHDLQIIKKKIETGQHYFTKEELDAIWWDGYEEGLWIQLTPHSTMAMHL